MILRLHMEGGKKETCKDRKTVSAGGRVTKSLHGQDTSLLPAVITPRGGVCAVVRIRCQSWRNGQWEMSVDKGVVGMTEDTGLSWAHRWPQWWPPCLYTYGPGPDCLPPKLLWGQSSSLVLNIAVKLTPSAATMSPTALVFKSWHYHLISLWCLDK